MPGRFFLQRSSADLARLFAVPEPEGRIVPRRNIAPGQEIITFKGDGGLVFMRWGMIPVGRVNARGRTVMETIVNARSETLFDKSAFLSVALPCTCGWLV